MAVSKNTERITISLDKEVKKQLDKYARQYDIPTSRLARNMVYVGLEHFDFLHKCGFGHITKGIDKFKELFQNLLDSDERMSNEKKL